MEKQSLNEKFTNVLQSKKLEKTGASKFESKLIDGSLNISHFNQFHDRTRMGKNRIPTLYDFGAKTQKESDYLTKKKDILFKLKSSRLYENNKIEHSEFIQGGSNKPGRILKVSNKELPFEQYRQTKIIDTNENRMSFFKAQKESDELFKARDIGKKHRQIKLDKLNKIQNKNKLLIGAGITGTLGIGAYLNHKRKTNVN